MNFRLIGATAMAVAAWFGLATTQASAANLVNNGDFSNIGGAWVGNVWLGSDDLRTPGSTNIPGWTNVSGFANEMWITPNNSYGLTASPGNGSGYFVDLTGQANDKPYGGISQTIQTTAGQQYKLTFALGASTLYNSGSNGPASLTASAAGSSQLFTLTPTSSNTWATETLFFTAVGSSTTIEFLANSNVTSQYTGLDNVSVSAVPLPGALPMFGAALVGLGGLARRRAKKAA